MKWFPLRGRHLTLLTIVAMALAGCSADIPMLPDGGDWGGGFGNNRWNPWADCGSRTVTSIPAPGFVEMTFSNIEANITPSDSALARVLFPSMVCGLGLDTDLGAFHMLYEIDAQGSVIATYSLMEAMGQKYSMRSDPMVQQQFVVEGRCLRLDSDMSDGGSLGGQSGIDPTDLPQTRCGLGQIAIGRSGILITTDPQEPYICVRADYGSACRDCWFDDGQWHEKTTISGSYVALGSLDHVSVETWAQLCQQEQETVNIDSGDRVEISWATHIVYQTSASPEELGYQAFEMPTWP